MLVASKSETKSLPENLSRNDFRRSVLSAFSVSVFAKVFKIWINSSVKNSCFNCEFAFSNFLISSLTASSLAAFLAYSATVSIVSAKSYSGPFFLSYSILERGSSNETSSSTSLSSLSVSWTLSLVVTIFSLWIFLSFSSPAFIALITSSYVTSVERPALSKFSLTPVANERNAANRVPVSFLRSLCNAGFVRIFRVVIPSFGSNQISPCFSFNLLSSHSIGAVCMNLLPWPAKRPRLNTLSPLILFSNHSFFTASCSCLIASDKPVMKWFKYLL